MEPGPGGSGEDTDGGWAIRRPRPLTRPATAEQPAPDVCAASAGRLPTMPGSSPAGVCREDVGGGAAWAPPHADVYRRATMAAAVAEAEAEAAAVLAAAVVPATATAAAGRAATRTASMTSEPAEVAADAAPAPAGPAALLLAACFAGPAPGRTSGTPAGPSAVVAGSVSAASGGASAAAGATAPARGQPGGERGGSRASGGAVQHVRMAAAAAAARSLAESPHDVQQVFCQALGCEEDLTNVRRRSKAAGSSESRSCACMVQSSTGPSALGQRSCGVGWRLTYTCCCKRSHARTISVTKKNSAKLKKK